MTINELNINTEKIKEIFLKKYKASSPSSLAEFSDYDKLNVIGKGAYSTVILYRHKTTKNYMVCKRLLKQNIMKKNQLRQILHEKQILKAIEWPFIISLLNSYKDNDAVYLTMPFINGGDLLTLLKRHRKLSEPSARFFGAQLVLAIEYLHLLDIIHRDIKPENILIDEHGYIKLADLGLSKLINDRLWSFCGTPEYVSPEIIQSKGYGKATDWWSFGILIYELCMGRTPFFKEQNHEMEMYANILSGEYSIPNLFSNNLQDLIQHLIQVDLTRRFGCLKNGVNDIKAHKWFKDIDWKALYRKEIKAPMKPTIKHDGDIANFGKYVEEIFLRSANCKFELEFADY